MNVLHLLVSGGTGGIEILMKDYAQNSTHKNTFVFVWKSGEIAELMKENGASVHITNAGAEGMLTTLKKIRHICMTEKIDVVVSHNAAPLLKLALIYMKLTVPGIRVVAYAHANARDICEHGRKKGLFLRKLVHRMGFAAADRIVAISDSVGRSLRDYLHVNGRKIRRIYNGTQLRTADPESIARNNTDPLKLIYVGRLIREKGVQNTLKALAALEGKVPFTFTVAGDGPFRGELEALVKQLELEDRVRFLGNRRDVPELLADADVFIHLPEWEEGFGITVIEALAAGLPCVVNDRGALPEIVEDRKSGYIVSAKTPENVPAVLEEIRNKSGESLVTMGNAARERAKQFSMEMFVTELDGCLAEVCR